MKRLFSVAFAAALSVAAFAQSEAPAFPGAEGHGRYVTGGRGGKVIHVTTLEDTSSKGSLRWALSQSGARIIVFDVSGYIDLTKDLEIKKGDVTIAGQTAPGAGITLRYYTLAVKADNVIIRFLRVRRGQEKDVNDGADACWGREQTGLLLDHCSFSWSIDECASFYDNRDFTMQWCTLGESLNNAGHDKGAHGYAGIWGGKQASFHHNFLLHHTNRTPRLNGARYGWEGYDKTLYNNTIDAEIVDFRNCVMYNWGTGNGAYGGMGGYHNIVNNYYKSGAATKNKYRVFECSVTTGKETLPAGIYGHFYINGNYVNGKGASYDWKGVKIEDSNTTIADTIKLTSPVITGEVTTHSAETAFEKVLAYAGASLNRDDVDTRYAEEAKNGTTTYTGSVTNLAGIIDVVADCGGYPTLTATEAPTDTDADGIPDAWETANGLDPNDASDAALYTIDTDKKYYSNLEVYLNSLVQDIMVAENENAESSVSEYYPAYTKEDGTKVAAINGTTSINNLVADTDIVETSYYNLQGMKVAAPSKGVYVKVGKTANGQSLNKKIIAK